MKTKTLRILQLLASRPEEAHPIGAWAAELDTLPRAVVQDFGDLYHQGLVSCTYVQPSNGPRRALYQISRKGRKAVKK